MAHPALAVARELAQLTPIELDAYVFSRHPDGLPYRSDMYPDDFVKLASALLVRDSPGDVLAGIEHIIEGREE